MGPRQLPFLEQVKRTLGLSREETEALEEDVIAQADANGLTAAEVEELVRDMALEIDSNVANDDRETGFERCGAGARERIHRSVDRSGQDWEIAPAARALVRPCPDTRGRKICLTRMSRERLYVVHDESQRFGVIPMVTPAAKRRRCCPVPYKSGGALPA